MVPFALDVSIAYTEGYDKTSSVNSRAAAGDYKQNSAALSASAIVTSSATAATSFYAVALVYSNVKTTGGVQAGSYEDPGDSTTHYLATTGLTTTSNALAIGQGMTSVSHDSHSPTGSWTQPFASAVPTLIGYFQLLNATLSSERGQWTSSFSRAGAGGMIVLEEAAAAGGATVSQAETVTATDQATVALLAALVTATASETVTVADAALSAALTVLIDLSQAEAITVEDTALQAVGILVSAAEWSGEDTITSSNW